MVGLEKILEWKIKEGYKYVAVNEYTGEVEFIKEKDLNKWFLTGYRNYLMEESDPEISSLHEYRSKNKPDDICSLLGSKQSGMQIHMQVNFV